MIQKIVVDIATTFAEGADTTAAVYLGLGGREFRMDIQDHDDFEEGDEVTYVFGEGANVLFPERNDPRLGLRLTVDDVKAFPAYLRLDPHKDKDDWEVANVRVTVHAEEGQVVLAALQAPDERLWLGRQSGNLLYLRRT